VVSATSILRGLLPLSVDELVIRLGRICSLDAAWEVLLHVLMEVDQGPFLGTAARRGIQWRLLCCRPVASKVYQIALTAVARGLRAQLRYGGPWGYYVFVVELLAFNDRVDSQYLRRLLLGCRSISATPLAHHVSRRQRVKASDIVALMIHSRSSSPSSGPPGPP
jgi:hypothetical protein